MAKQPRKKKKPSANGQLNPERGPFTGGKVDSNPPKWGFGGGNPKVGPSPKPVQSKPTGKEGWGTAVENLSNLAANAALTVGAGTGGKPHKLRPQKGGGKTIPSTSPNTGGKGVAGSKVYGPPAPKPKTKIEKQQIRLDKKYGSGAAKATGGGKAVATKPGKGGNSRPSSKGSSKPTAPVKDEITQMIEAATQQSQRYTDFYNKQNEAIRSATTADSLKLAEAAGAMGTVAPVEYGAGSTLDAAANASGLGTYSNLVNAATSTAARNLSDASKAKIASGGAAQQRYFGGNRDVVNARNVEYLRALKASEPKLRREKQASDAKIALDQALAAYTQQNSLANLEIKKGQLALDGQRLDETIRNNNLSSADRAAARQQAVILAQIKATQGAAGQAGSSTAAQQKAVRSWVQANLYGTQNTKNDDGSQSQSTKVMLKNPYSKTMQEMSRYGFPKSEILKFAIAHDDGALKKDGPVNFYLAMNNMGVSSRASVSYLKQAGFKQKDIREIIKYKNNIPELIRKQAAGLLK